MYIGVSKMDKVVCERKSCEGCLKICEVGDMRNYEEYVEKVRKGRNVDDGFEGVEIW